MNASRRRFWISVSLAVVAAFLAVLAFVWKTWIESATGLEPDGGDGSFEWLVVVGCLGLSLAFTSVARWEWRRLQAAAQHVREA
jgi:hypothetical protein